MFMHACSVVSSSLQPHGLWPTRLAHMSMEFSRQEYWSRLPFAIPRDYTFSYINNEYSLSMKIECTEMCISWTHQLSWKKSCSYYNNILVLVHIYLIYLIMCNPYRSQMHSFLYLLYLLAQHLAVTFQYMLAGSLFCFHTEIIPSLITYILVFQKFCGDV